MMRDFGVTLKSLRLEVDLKQEEVANGIGVSKQVISNYENSQREPDFATLIKLAQFFDVSTDYLLGVSEYRDNPQLELTSSYKILQEILPYLSIDAKESVFNMLNNVISIFFSCAKTVPNENSCDEVLEIYEDEQETSQFEKKLKAFDEVIDRIAIVAGTIMSLPHVDDFSLLLSNKNDNLDTLVRDFKNLDKLRLSIREGIFKKGTEIENILLHIAYPELFDKFEEGVNNGNSTETR